MSDERRQARWVLGLALVAWAVVSAPLASGSRTLYQRDVLSVHAPWKAFGAEAMRHGSVPPFNPTWGLGQPFRGNPNALPLYPGNLLYLALPFWIAFNLHFALHWLLALFAGRALARSLGMKELAAAVAAVTYAGSGYVLSCLSFYNLVAVVAWWPLAMWGAVVGGRRGIALGGLACGMALYAGEPVTVALAAVPLLLAAGERHGWRRGVAIGGAIGVVGLLVALPQVVAAARVADFTYRGAHGAIASEAVTFALHPLRWLELVVPLPFGDPSRAGLGGWWATLVSGNPPLFFSLYLGCVGLWLATLAGGKRAWWSLAVAGWTLAWLLGLSGELLVRATAGLFRFPEKLLIWPAIALPLLAGWGLERMTAGRGWRRAAIAAALLALLAAATASARPALARSAARGSERPERAELWMREIAGGWTRDLAIAAGLLAGAAWAARRGDAGIVAGLQVAALVQLFPLAATAPLAPLRNEPVEWAEALEGAGAIVDQALVHPRWDERGFAAFDGPAWSQRTLERQRMAPWVGVPRGHSYPLAPDVEGSQSPLHSLLLFNLPKFSPAQRLRWLRVLGVDRLILLDGAAPPGLEALGRSQRLGTESWLFGVETPAPPVDWPARVEVAATPVEVLRRVSFGEDDPLLTAVVPEPVEHRAGGTVTLIEERPARLVFESRSEGGLVVVRRAYQPLYRARAGEVKLRTLPVNLVLLGVVVPPGERRVVLDVGAGPEIAAAAVALATALVALLAGLGPRRV